MKSRTLAGMAFSASWSARASAVRAIVIKTSSVRWRAFMRVNASSSCGARSEFVRRCQAGGSRPRAPGPEYAVSSVATSTCRAVHGGRARAPLTAWAGRPIVGRHMSEFPSFDLEGRVALVTGAARGLGNAIARALAHAGADVALGLRDLNTGAELAGAIEAMGRRALPLQMDVRHLDQIFAAVEGTVRRFGRLDLLVNNAGIAPENP